MKLSLLRLLLIALASFQLSGCGVTEPEDENKFLYNFEGQHYRQTRYRSIEENGTWRAHTGLRTMLVKPGSYNNSFNGYREIAFSIYCYGQFDSTHSYVSEENFFAAIAGSTTPSAGNSNPYYDVFEPWDSGSVAPGGSTDEKIEAVNYYMVVTVTSNTVTSNCSFPVETTQYLHFKLHQNGDLVLRDYNREIEFFMRPSN